MSQATGGLSDIVDLTRLATRGIQKLTGNLDDIQRAYDDAGFNIVQQTDNNIVYEVPRADGNGTFYSRLQRGSGDGELRGDRIVNTQNNGNPNNKQYVNPDGSPILGPISREERRRIGHIHIEASRNE